LILRAGLIENRSLKINMMKLPLVTIGIPNYNYAAFVPHALNAVANQTYGNCEIIIVDDCSSDHSVEVIEDWIKSYKGNFEITFIKNSFSHGIANVSNIILNNAAGKYYQILDADDVILRDKIANQVAIIEESENCAVVYSNIGVINDQGEIANNDYLKRIGYDQNLMPSGNVFSDLLNFNFIPNPSTLIRTDSAKEIGGYDESIFIQDYYIYLSLSEHFDFIYQKGVTAYYRLHGTSLSNNNHKSAAKISEGVLRLLQRYYKKSCANCPDENAKFKAQFRNNVFNMAPYFYKHDYPTAKYWLIQNFRLNPGIRSMVYLVAFSLGFRYAVIEKIKSWL
jgi:glycosyltransferase involved in cell wall biosynthesis